MSHLVTFEMQGSYRYLIHCGLGLDSEFEVSSFGLAEIQFLGVDINWVASGDWVWEFTVWEFEV